MEFQKSQRAFSAMMPPWWQTAFKMWEIGVATPQVIAHRTARMAAAGHMPSARDQREFTRMGQEKLEAFTESWTAMGAQMAAFNMQFASLAVRQWSTWAMLPQLALAGTPAQMAKAQSAAMRGMLAFVSCAGNKQLSDSWLRVISKGLAPVHKRATANVKRLQGF